MSKKNKSGTLQKLPLPPGMDEEDIKVKVQRIIRKQKYKKLLDEGGQLSLKAETTDVVDTLEGVLRIVRESNVLQRQGKIKDRAENATEVLMDAQVLKLSHEIMGAAMQRMGNSEFSDDEFANVILASMEDENSTPLNILSKRAVGIFNRSKFRISLYGTLKETHELTQKIVKERQKRQKANYGEVKKPITVDKLRKEEKGAQKLNLILKQITTIYNQRQKSIPYFEMITDPEDFMNTVDNAFQISFLVRDGTVVLEVDDNAEPFIRPSTAEEKQELPSMPDSVQSILGLNTKRWKQMIEKFEIEEPLLLINREDFSTQVDTTQS